MLVFLVILFQTESNNDSQPIAHPTSTPVSYRTILSGIQSLDELITLRVDVALVELEVRDPASLGCTYTAQHVARGVVEASVNLAEINEERIEKNVFGYPTKVTVPAPKISSCHLDYFRQYDQRGGGTAKCFGDNWDAMSQIGEHIAMEQFVIHALEKDILERAGRQAVYVVGSFVNNLTGGNVQIEHEEIPEEPFIPPSCKIEHPDNWEQRDDDNGWRRTR